MRFGLTGLGFDLTARVFDFEPGPWYLTNLRESTYCVVYNVPDPDQLPTFFTYAVLPEPDANFPYGFTVEPDEPV